MPRGVKARGSLAVLKANAAAANAAGAVDVVSPAVQGGGSHLQQLLGGKEGQQAPAATAACESWQLLGCDGICYDRCNGPSSDMVNVNGDCQDCAQMRWPKLKKSLRLRRQRLQMKTWFWGP